MFDYVDYECPCPNCGGLITEFQTKDADIPSFDWVSPLGVSHFIAICPGCGYWVEFDRKPAQSVEADFTVRTEVITRPKRMAEPPQPAQTANTPKKAAKMGTIDQTPPPDHEQFERARQFGLRSVNKAMKRREEPHRDLISAVLYQTTKALKHGRKRFSLGYGGHCYVIDVPEELRALTQQTEKGSE